jgi:hypothetical protein
VEPAYQRLRAVGRSAGPRWAGGEAGHETTGYSGDRATEFKGLRRTSHYGLHSDTGEKGRGKGEVFTFF